MSAVNQTLVKAYVRPKAKATIQAYCKDKGVSVSEVIGDLLDGFIQTLPPQQIKVVPPKNKSHNHY